MTNQLDFIETKQANTQTKINSKIKRSALLFFFLGLHPWHMEIPRLEVQLELQLPVYAIATAMQDPSCVFNLHHTSWQRQVLNPLSKARDRTCNLMVPSWIRFHCTMTGTPDLHYFYQLMFVINFILYLLCCRLVVYF